MQRSPSLKTVIVLSTLSWLFLLLPFTSAEAGCGCNKPPPKPAAILQSAAFAGMPVTFLDDRFQEGQMWTVFFQSGSTTAQVTAPVVLRRDLTNPTGTTLRPQLVVPLPSLPMGPASITVSIDSDSFFVPEDSFTVIAQPVALSNQIAEYDFYNYTTAVSHNGVLYMSISGLDGVCQAMEFQIRVREVPLRIDQIAIYNTQGFLIDALGPAAADIFSVEPEDKDDRSDRVRYFRHSFAEYCANHMSGGTKEVDSQDPNWHLDGTPHVDYATLIFAITGFLDDGSGPTPLTPGEVSYEKLDIETDLGLGIEPWEPEHEEEGIEEPHTD